MTMQHQPRWQMVVGHRGRREKGFDLFSHRRFTGNHRFDELKRSIAAAVTAGHGL
jgi:hypothetical protein